MRIQTELIHRESHHRGSQESKPPVIQQDAKADDEEMESLPSRPNASYLYKPAAGAVPDSSKTSDAEVFDSALKNLNPRWKNWTIRTIFTLLMLTGFYFIICMGPFGILLLIVMIAIKCLNEVSSIGLAAFQANNLPFIKPILWYHFLIHGYNCFGRSFYKKFHLDFRDDQLIYYLSLHHKFITFWLYIIGIVGFVLTLRPKLLIKQYMIFGYLQICLAAMTQGLHAVEHTLNGMIWFLLPVLLVIANDIFAYIFGFFYGRTKLISLSPKKTWEGLVGAAIATILLGFLVSALLVQFPLLICPLQSDGRISECQPAAVFRLTEYKIFSWLRIYLYPIQLHTLFFGLVVSTVGPFGGFMASGFKRAVQIKDFGNTIPGHGGFMDRFDCQFIMGVFVSAYVNSFIELNSPLILPVSQRLFNQFSSLSHHDQEQFMNILKNNHVSI